MPSRLQATVARRSGGRWSSAAPSTRSQPHGPDYLIGYDPKSDEYGVWVHDGRDGQASSWIGIAFCPFCGSRLPRPRRADWFARLEKAGLDPLKAPAELRRYGWWRQN